MGHITNQHQQGSEHMKTQHQQGREHMKHLQQHGRANRKNTSAGQRPYEKSTPIEHAQYENSSPTGQGTSETSPPTGHGTYETSSHNQVDRGRINNQHLVGKENMNKPMQGRRKQLKTRHPSGPPWAIYLSDMEPLIWNIQKWQIATRHQHINDMIIFSQASKTQFHNNAQASANASTLILWCIQCCDSGWCLCVSVCLFVCVCVWFLCGLGRLCCSNQLAKTTVTPHLSWRLLWLWIWLWLYL